MPPWEYHAYCRFMHLCVGQLLVSTLITMSIPMPYAGAVTNPSVTCHKAFDKYSSLGQQPVPRMVIHWWSPHEALWQWHCINNADQKVAIWHLECSFIWVMSLFVAGEDCYNSPSLSWRCHIPRSQASLVVTRPRVVADTELGCHHIPRSVKRNTWPCVSRDEVKIIPDDGNTGLWSAIMVIMSIMRMIGMHLSLGNSRAASTLSIRMGEG